MNLRCQPFLLISVIIFSFLCACVKEDQDDCNCTQRQGLNIHLYSLNPCQADTIYPDNIRELTLGVFDKNGLLVTHTMSTDVELNSNYFEQLEVSTGLYTVIAWAGLEENYFDIAELQDGVTTRTGLLFRIQRAGEIAASIEGVQLFYGESAAVYVEENREPEFVWENVSVNMQEITNRITISVDGLETPNDYEIIIESNNGSMNMNGTIASDETLLYEANYTNTEEILSASFTTLKLQTGITNTIVIRNREDETEIFRGNLLGALLLRNPDINLACDHDFTINFTTEDQCDCGTYIITEIWVNNWLVHSYDTQM